MFSTYVNKIKTYACWLAPVSLAWKGGDRRIPGTYWPACPCESVSDYVKDFVSDTKVERYRGRHEPLARTGTYRQDHKYTRRHTHTPLAFVILCVMSPGL